MSTPPPLTYLELQYATGSGFASACIEIFGAGQFSHVDIVWPDGRLFGARSDKIKVGDLTYPKGVQFRPSGYLDGEKTARISIPCTPEQKARGLSWALTQEGMPYDPLAIIAFGFGRNWRTEGAWFCSEFVTRFEEIALNFVLPLTQNKITPGTSAAISGALARIKDPFLP